MYIIARRHTLFGLCFAVVGMGLGIYMAASHNHQQHVTHAHLLLVGFVVSLVYAGVYRLWLADEPSTLARVQLVLHHIGTVFMSLGLFLLYGRWMAPAMLEPLLALASIAVLLAAVLMLVLFVRATRAVTVAGRDMRAAEV